MLFCKNSSTVDWLNRRCKPCDGVAVSNYRKTKDGLSANMYGRQRVRSKAKGYPMPTYTLKEFRVWLYSQPIFHILFDAWVVGNYSKILIPSCDRLDDYKPYTLDNLRVVTWLENKLRGENDVRNGINNKKSKSVTGIDMVSGDKRIFHSQSEAQRQTGVHQSSISACCLDNRRYAGNYFWEDYEQ